jgi:uncharacterized lipoprotein YddW (UPF0748 family)
MSQLAPWVALPLVLGLGLPSIRAAEAVVPSPPREFRGVWVATVANIDWPSKKGLPVEKQKGELIAILDRAVALKLNAIVLQVRPMCDALYASKLEPWSEFLTGKLGQAPEPFYDPLEFAVRESHARGLELHAWFNPYRAHHPSATSPIPDSHIVKAWPDLAKPYGKHSWLNPTAKEVQDHSIAVILDVVRRYDIDGVHMDDYFYPYKERDASGQIIPFPDDDTRSAYLKAGGTLSRGDWRRDAVNHFVERLYREVKAAKPWVKVGISPFGIWRPGSPPGIEGFDQYTELHADARLWLREGWVDYWTPQLYWPINQEKQSYAKLLAWWSGENVKGRHLWLGNAPYRINSKGWPPEEITNQIKVTRAQKGATGNIHFSMKALMKDGAAADALKAVYTEPALVPASPWLGGLPPAKPQIEWRDEAGKNVLRARASGEGVRLFVVRSQLGGKWTIQLSAAHIDQPTVFSFEMTPDQLAISAIDRVGNESELVTTGK